MVPRHAALRSHTHQAPRCTAHLRRSPGRRRGRARWRRCWRRGRCNGTRARAGRGVLPIPRWVALGARADRVRLLPLRVGARAAPGDPCPGSRSLTTSRRAAPRCPSDAMGARGRGRDGVSWRRRMGSSPSLELTHARGLGAPRVGWVALSNDPTRVYTLEYPGGHPSIVERDVATFDVLSGSVYDAPHGSCARPELSHLRGWAAPGGPGAVVRRAVAAARLRPSEGPRVGCGDPRGRPRRRGAVGRRRCACPRVSPLGPVPPRPALRRDGRGIHA